RTIPPSASTTVRHTPFTARLSPADKSAARSVVTRRLSPVAVWVTVAIWPSDSMRPVNISLDHDVLPEWLCREIAQARDLAGRQVNPVHAIGAERVRRDEKLNAVDESGPPERLVQRRTSFDDHRHQTTLAEAGQHPLQKPLRFPLVEH